MRYDSTPSPLWGEGFRAAILRKLSRKSHGGKREGCRRTPLTQRLRRAPARPARLMRKGEPLYAELGLKDRDLDDDALIALMVANPILIERPIVVSGGKAALGRPPESVLKIL